MGKKKLGVFYLSPVHSWCGSFSMHADTFRENYAEGELTLFSNYLYRMNSKITSQETTNEEWEGKSKKIRWCSRVSYIIEYF